jgi:hypothetical protein
VPTTPLEVAFCKQLYPISPFFHFFAITIYNEQADLSHLYEQTRAIDKYKNSHGGHIMTFLPPQRKTRKHNNIIYIKLTIMSNPNTPNKGRGKGKVPKNSPKQNSPSTGNKGISPK